MRTPLKFEIWNNLYYCTIIKPVLLYGSTIWTSCKEENLLKLLRLQKRAARFILDAERTASSVSLFNTLKWVPSYAESYVNQCTLFYFDFSFSFWGPQVYQFYYCRYGYPFTNNSHICLSHVYTKPYVPRCLRHNHHRTNPSAHLPAPLYP